MKGHNKHNYIFTFGCGHANEGQYQLVQASSWSKARAIMIAKHGTAWAFQYTQEVWDSVIDNAIRNYMQIESPLNEVLKEEDFKMKCIIAGPEELIVCIGDTYEGCVVEDVEPHTEGLYYIHCGDTTFIVPADWIRWEATDARV